MNHFSPDGTAEQLDERARLFINAYTDRFGMPPDGPAALGYDAVNILIAAMKRTSQLTPVSICDQIQVTQNYRGQQHCYILMKTGMQSKVLLSTPLWTKISAFIDL